MDVATAADRIASLFADGGQVLLGEAGLTSWQEALGLVPGEYLDVPVDDDAGVHLLGNVREYFSQQDALRPAIALTQALFRHRQRTLGEQHPDTLVELGALGALADRAGRVEDAGRMLDRAYQGLRSSAGGRDLRLAIVANHLALHALRTRKPLDAEQHLETSLRIRREVAPETSGLLAAQLAELMLRRGQVEPALPYLVEAFERFREQYGTGDPRTVARARTLAVVLTQLDREAEAIPVLRVIHEATVREGDDEARAAVGYQLGNALEMTGQRDQAWRLVEDSVRWTRDAGDPHPELPTRLTTLSHMAIRRGRPVEAEGLLREALEADVRLRGANEPEIAVRYFNLGQMAVQFGRFDEALGWIEAAAKLSRTTLGDDHWQTKQAVEPYVTMLVALAKKAVNERQYGYAREILLKAQDVAVPVLGPKHKLVYDIQAFNLV